MKYGSTAHPQRDVFFAAWQRYCKQCISAYHRILCKYNNLQYSSKYSKCQYIARFFLKNKLLRALHKTTYSFSQIFFVFLYYFRKPSFPNIKIRPGSFQALIILNMYVSNGFIPLFSRYRPSFPDSGQSGECGTCGQGYE